MKTVYFVRHGESEANVGHPTYQGETSKLTERGKEQGRFIANRCKRLRIDALIASTTPRAQETAQLIAREIGKEVEACELFTERKLPTKLIGMPKEEPAARKLQARWEQSLYNPETHVEDGENFSDIKMRAEEALAYLEKRPEVNLLVVTHGFFLRTMIARIVFGEALTPEEFKKIISTFRTSNTELTLVQFAAGEEESWGLPPNPWVIRAWNDHAHLG